MATTVKLSLEAREVLETDNINKRCVDTDADGPFISGLIEYCQERSSGEIIYRR